MHLRPPSKWDRPAAALQSGGIGVIARGMTRRQAMSLRRRIRAGEIIAFRPKGDWRVEIAPDHAQADKWRVLAQYQGR